MAERRRLNWRERRELGLTIRELTKTAREVRDADPEEFAVMSHSELAAAILAKKSDQLITSGNIDWDAIIEFIERLIPLILKLIEALS